MLYEEPDLVVRSVRDLVSADLEESVLDDKRAYTRVKEFIDTYMPGFEGRVRLYEYDEPIFDAYGLEAEIARSLLRKVDLESGGHLVIDRSEALTAVDVNTGKFVGKGSTSLEDTILITNLEAADEVVYQLRLRNIGGLIIIDFIDMEDPKHRQKVYRRLEKRLKKDRVTSNALAISEFGLVEMTRKRVRESLQQFLCEPCSWCDSRGFVKSKETVAYEVLRELKRECPVRKPRDLYVQANPIVIDFMRNIEKKAVKDLEGAFDKKIHLHSNKEMHIETFSVSAKAKK
jgi:ribonuclease G